MRDARRSGFIIVASLFFVWGFISANNDPLLVALRNIYSLSWLAALMTHFIFAIAFGLVSLPAAALAGRIGLGSTAFAGLVAIGAGCLLVALSAGHASYPFVLAALFVAASGVVILQVAANPLAAGLGDPRSSTWRLNLAQALNSLGVVIGANSGAAIMLTPAASGGIFDVRRAYLVIAGLALVAGALFLTRLRAIASAELVSAEVRTPTASAFRSPWAWFAAIAIGLYVGAETTLSSLMIGFLGQSSVLGAAPEAAGKLLANVYWGGALAGRIAGIALLARISGPRLLLVCAAIAALLCTVATMGSGPIAGFAALGVGLVNSIMFPTIFAIGLERSRLPAAAASGLMCVTIVGGALLPLGAARIADVAGLSAALALPAAAYLFILIFALRAIRFIPAPPSEVDR